MLVVSLVASNLSAVARARTREAEARRDELGRLFDLSRDILLITESQAANASLAAFIARRFDFDYVAICVPQGSEWACSRPGSPRLTPDPRELSAAAQTASRTDSRRRRARRRSGLFRSGSAPSRSACSVWRDDRARARRSTPSRASRRSRSNARSFSTIARRLISRARARRLKSALLASLGHDLRTPLTAIRVAASNLQASWPDERERREQSDLILTEVDRLTRLFQNILEMARIDAGADHRGRTVGVAVGDRRGRAQPASNPRCAAARWSVSVESERLVRLDPRLTAAALSHLLENAAQYSPAGSPIGVDASVDRRRADDRRPRSWSRHS